jgi:hypothetical protein
MGALRAPERARRSRSTDFQHRSGNTKSSRAATVSGSSSSGGGFEPHERGKNPLATRPALWLIVLNII